MSKPKTDEFKIADAAAMTVEAPPLTRHPGVFIREVLLPEYGIKSVVQLASMLKVNRPNLAEVLAGKRDVSRELAYRLGALMNDAVADLVIAYQQRWDMEQEREHREELKREIERLPEDAAA